MLKLQLEQKKRTKTTLPWINGEIKELKRKCRRAERKWRKTNLTIHYDILCIQLKTSSNSAKQARTIHFSNLIIENKNNQKCLFKTIDLLMNRDFNKSSLPPSDAACEDFADHLRN